MYMITLQKQILNRAQTRIPKADEYFVTGLFAGSAVPFESHRFFGFRAPQSDGFAFNQRATSAPAAGTNS